MTLVTLRLGNKLREYVKELRKITDETKTVLVTCAAPEEKQYDAISCTLKKSSTLLSKLLSHVEDLQSKIEQALLARESKKIDDDLSEILDSADRAEVQAEVILSEIEAKLSHIDELKDSQLSLEGLPSRPKGNFFDQDFVDSLTKGVDLLKIQLNGAESTDTVLDSAEVPQCDFNLKRFYSDERDFKQFWREYNRTVEKSPLEFKQKFAALRGMVRGEAYRLFLDLDYHSEKGYHVALSRLSDKYAKQTAELQQELLAEPSTSPIEPEAEAPADTTSSNTTSTVKWSDEYFFTKYCKDVPNYKTPDRDLLVRAIHSFLNVYVVGPNKASTKNFVDVFNILLHGVKFDYELNGVKYEDQYITRLKDGRKFGKDDEVVFENIEKYSQEALQKFTPFLLVEKRTDESKPHIWKWKYTSTDKEREADAVISSRCVKEWYATCWTKVETCDEKEFQDWVKYFALLSMVLLRVVIKERESVERYIALGFNRTFRAFCHTHFMPNAVPPHSGIYNLIRKVEFRKNKDNFRRYLTYLVGCYAFCDGHSKKKREVRDFLNAGCLLTLRCTGTGSIYWLIKVSERKQLKPQEVLMYFLIDPSMEKQVKTMNQFLEKYHKKEFTWWWARSFNSKMLREISTFYCPQFAYACHIIAALNETEIKMSRHYPQFSRFMKDGNSIELHGHNLGIALRHIINEWNMTPLSPLTKCLYKKIEQQKCKERP